MKTSRDTACFTFYLTSNVQIRGCLVDLKNITACINLSVLSAMGRNASISTPCGMETSRGTAWFTVEVTVRFVSCPGKLQFWKDFKNVVDVMAIVPYYVTLFNVLSTMSCSSAKSSASLAFLRVIRLVRIFKLTKHSVGLQVRSLRLLI